MACTASYMYSLNFISFFFDLRPVQFRLRLYTQEKVSLIQKFEFALQTYNVRGIPMLLCML